MPLELDVDLDEIEAKDGGKGLRKWAETVQAEMRKVSAENVTLKAGQVIQEHGYSRITADDLAGTPLDELEAKAERLEAEKLEAEKELARGMLARQGLEGDDLEQALAEFIQQDAEAVSRERVAAATRAGGTVAPLVNTEQLHGVEAIRHGLSKTTK
jgi:hypothetical protein